MYYVYVLQSLTDGNFYIGFTTDLENRLRKHNSGMVYSTKDRIPFKLIYHEACINKDNALHREKYFKTTYGRRFIKNRLKNYFNENN